MTQIADTLPALEAEASLAKPSFFERLKSTNWVMAWHYGSFPGLSDLKVSVRVTLLLILALLAATVFGAVSVIGERKVAQAVQAQLSYRALGDVAARVKSDGLKMQVLEQEFLRSRDPAFADAQVNVLSAMAAAVKDMAARPETEAVAGQLKDLSNRLDAHAAQFERVVATERLLGLSASDGLRGALGKSVKAMEDELKMWPNLDPLWNKMLGMRQAEKDFMLYGGDEYLGRFRKFAMEFDLKLDSAGLPASTANEFRGLLDRYKKDMAAFAEGAKTEDQARTQLHDEAVALSPVIDAIFNHAHDRALRSAQEQQRTRAAILFNNQLVGVLSLLAFLILSLVLSRTIVKPLRRIEDTMRRLVAGEHSVRVPCTGLGDEIGDMARAVEIFKENALNMVALQREHEGLMVNAETQRKAAMTNLADQFEGQVKTIALSVSTGGAVIADRARAMAMRDHHANESRSMAVVEAAAKSHEAVQAALEAARELGESIAEVSRLVDESGKVAAAGEVELGAVETQVVGLADAASHIGSVVDMISQIAHQTNLLALNATIEAARAGAAGKGFAVVAGEVKILAGQTAEATNRIVEQVATIQAATTDTVATVDRIAVTIRRMHEITIAVQGAMSRQGEATARIGTCVADVSTHSQFVAEGVVAVAHSAATYCGSAIQVLWAANDLSQPVSRLNAEMDGFLGRVRG